MSSILREALLESKKIREEALALAKLSLLKEHKGTLDKLASDLFRKKMNENSDKSDKSKEDDEDNKLDTRIKGDEIQDYLDSEIGKNKDDIEIEINLSDEKDDEKIEETFNALAENDEVLIIKEKDNEELKKGDKHQTTNDNLKQEMEQAKKEITEMENINKELNDLEVDLKEDVTSEIVDDQPSETGGAPEVVSEPVEGDSVSDDQIAEAFNSMSEEEKSNILEGLSSEEMDELAEALVLSLEDGEDEPQGDQPQVSEVPAVETPVEDEKPVDEAKSIGISNANARTQGETQGSYGRVEHSRDYEKTLQSIQETVGKLSSEAKRLEEENKALKSQMSALNESSSKLKGQNSEYASQLTKYKEKCYEALLEAKKAMCVNKILLENTTTKTEKLTIVESFASATTSKEIDLVNNHLLESLAKGATVNLIKESVNLEHIVNKTVMKSGSVQLVESTTPVNPMLAKMLKNIKYGDSKNNL